MWPEDEPKVFARTVWPPGAVQAVVEVDLSAQYVTSQLPLPTAVTAGLVWAAPVVLSTFEAEVATGLVALLLR